MKSFKSKNGVPIIVSKKFHEHSQINDKLLQEAIIGESKQIEDAFKERRKERSIKDDET